MGDDVSIIMAYGSLGDVVAELLLITLMNPFEHEAGISAQGWIE